MDLYQGRLMKPAGSTGRGNFRKKARVQTGAIQNTHDRGDQLDSRDG
jgi:hypothetical protein